MSALHERHPVDTRESYRTTTAVSHDVHQLRLELAKAEDQSANFSFLSAKSNRSSSAETNSCARQNPPEPLHDLTALHRQTAPHNADLQIRGTSRVSSPPGPFKKHALNKSLGQCTVPKFSDCPRNRHQCTRVVVQGETHYHHRRPQTPALLLDTSKPPRDHLP